MAAIEPVRRADHVGVGPKVGIEIATDRTELTGPDVGRVRVRVAAARAWRDQKRGGEAVAAKGLDNIKKVPAVPKAAGIVVA
jgi:hypothetical protein